MAEAQPRDDERDEHESVREKLEAILRDALKPTLGPRTQLLEEIVEVVTDALRGKLILGIRKPKARKTTRRALALRLPEIGVAFPYEHQGRTYKVTVVEEHMVELEDNMGKVERYRTLKAIAFAILGYNPPIGGWQFFFGGLTSDEVSDKYKTP